LIKGSNLKKENISIQPLTKALDSLTKILKEQKTDIVRDATIQRFEYTFELSWKIIKRYIESQQNIIESSIKNIFREAGKLGLIDNVEDWFGYLEARNRTSHTYSETTAEEVFLSAVKFEKSATYLKLRLEKLLE
jgi:nucleotidyltransferase substrate binding protein (TIGR01987 family)